ncbi:hypothetical protein JCM10295v2_003483 [Rhodotorula toruloides]
MSNNLTSATRDTVSDLPTSASTIQESQTHAFIRPNFAHSSSTSSDLMSQSSTQPHQEGQMNVGEQGQLHNTDLQETEGGIAKITSGIGGILVNAPLAAIEKISPSFAQGLSSAASSVATGVQNLASSATHAATQYSQFTVEESTHVQPQIQQVPPTTTGSVGHGEPGKAATGLDDSAKQPAQSVAETLPAYSSTGTSQVQEQSTVTRSTTGGAQGVGVAGAGRGHLEGIEAPGTRVLVQPAPGTKMSNEERELGGPTVPSAVAAQETVARSIPPANEAIGQGVETVKAAGNKAAEMLPPAERQKELAQATAVNVTAAAQTAYSAAASAAPVVADKSAQAASITAAGVEALATGVVHGAQAAAHAATEGAHCVQEYVSGTAESASNVAQVSAQRAVETGKSATSYAADTAKSATNATVDTAKTATNYAANTARSASNATAETARSARESAAEMANAASQKASDIGQATKQSPPTTSSYPLAQTPSDFTPGTAKIVSADSLTDTEQRYRNEEADRPIAAIMDHPDSSTQDKHEGPKSDLHRVHDEPAVTGMFPSNYPDESARQHQRDAGLAGKDTSSQHGHHSTGDHGYTDMKPTTASGVGSQAYTEGQSDRRMPHVSQSLPQGEGYENKTAQHPPTSRDTHTPSHVDNAHWGGDPVVYGASFYSHNPAAAHQAHAQSERKSIIPSSAFGGAGVDMRGSGSPHTFSSMTNTMRNTGNTGATGGLSTGDDEHHWVSASGEPVTGAAGSAATKGGRDFDLASSSGQYGSSADPYSTTTGSRYA